MCASFRTLCSCQIVATCNAPIQHAIRQKDFWSVSAAGGPLYSQVVMNLPASAVSFLDAFRGACTDTRWQGHLPHVNVYTFSKGDEDDAGAHICTVAVLAHAQCPCFTWRLC
jgi:hypothetical protein